MLFIIINYISFWELREPEDKLLCKAVTIINTHIETLGTILKNEVIHRKHCFT